MVYCQRCGTKNDDDAKFCKNCSASLFGPKRAPEKEWEDRCERECHEGTRAPLIWGVIIILIGLFIIFEFAVKNLPDMPGWVQDFPFWGIAALIIGLIVIGLGIKALTRQ